MADNKINVGGRLHSIATGNVLAGADEILDDNKGKKQSEINIDTDNALAERYTKGETYNKNQLNSLITTPNVQYVTSVATEQTTVVTDILPSTGAANTIYRVGKWNGTQYNTVVYSEYAWDGSTYVLLDVKEYGIDDKPTAGSDNFVKSRGVFESLTELAGEVFETKDTTVESPQYEEGFMYTDGRITSNTSYGIVKPIEMLKGDTIILNLGNGIYHGYGAAILFKCSSDGTFIESLISGSGTSVESWTNNTGETTYVGICAYKAQTGYIIRRKIALKTSLNEVKDSLGYNDSLSFDVAAGSTTPTTEKMDVDIAAGDIFYLKVSDTTGDGNAYQLYFQYDGQSSGTSIGSVLSGTAYEYTASQKIDKIYLWKKAVSTNKTVRIDVLTGMLGQINSTKSNLSTLKIATVKQAILSEAYTITSVTRNTSGNVTAASIVYPDGVTGTITVTRNTAGAATSVVYTYGTSTYTLTITRDSNNNVTATSLS